MFNFFTSFLTIFFFFTISCFYFLFYLFFYIDVLINIYLSNLYQTYIFKNLDKIFSRSFQDLGFESKITSRFLLRSYQNLLRLELFKSGLNIF